MTGKKLRVIAVQFVVGLIIITSLLVGGTAPLCDPGAGNCTRIMW